MCTLLLSTLRWSSLKKRLSLSKQRLTPHVQSHSAIITQDLKEYYTKLQSLHNSFLTSDCVFSHCSPDSALSLLQDYTDKLSVYQAQYHDLMELQELLQSAVVNFSLLKLLVLTEHEFLFHGDRCLCLFASFFRFEEELKTANVIWIERE